MRIVGYAPRRNEFLRAVWKRYVFIHLHASTQNAHLTFFSWQILKPRAWILKGVECSVNNEFFVHLQRKVLETQRVHQILRLNWKEASMKRRF